MKCDSVSQCSCLQSCAVHFLDQVVDGDASVQDEAWNGAQNMGRGGGEHHRNWLCIIRRVNSDDFPGGIYLTPPGLFSVLYWKLRSYTTLIWATFCSGTPFSLSLLSPVQAALQGDHYHSQKEHVVSSLWRRPERPTETLAGQTCWNQRAHPFSLWTHFPCTLTEWDCKWEQCVSYPLTTVRVTDSTSSRVQHVQSTHENHASIQATHSKVITKPFKISICVVRTCAMNHTVCFLLAGSGQADVVQICSSPLLWTAVSCSPVLVQWEACVSGLLLCHYRGTQSCTVCYSHTFMSPTPTHSDMHYCTALDSHEATPTHTPHNLQECRLLRIVTAQAVTVWQWHALCIGQS